MKYELQILDALIQSDIHPANFNNKKLENDQFLQWQSIALRETERIKNAFKNNVFSLKKERQIETYIQQHQQELIRLTDQLLQYFHPEEAVKIYEVSDEKTSTNLYKYVYQCLEDLLTYIEKYFSKYFSLRAKIPDCYKLIAIRDFQECFPDVESSLKEMSASEKLLHVVFLPIKRFTEDKHKEDISFRKLIYLKSMLKELKDLSAMKLNNADLNQKIICNLTYLNYNSYRFFGYCTEHIKKHYQQEDTLCGQIEKLAWFYKNISQAQVKPGVSYKPKQKPLKENLLEWIDEEMGFLEKRKQLTLNLPVNKYEGLPLDFKINTNLSVSQLAYLIKLFMESGVMLNRNQREVLRFMSQFTRTKRAENVSAESLRTKFYNVEHNTKETVKDILIDMVNHIRKN